MVVRPTPPPPHTHTHTHSSHTIPIPQLISYEKNAVFLQPFTEVNVDTVSRQVVVTNSCTLTRRCVCLPLLTVGSGSSQSESN